MNHFLIAANIVVFLLSMHFVRGPQGEPALDLRPWAEPFMFLSDHPSIWQFVTYAFLHGDLWHIFGNMFFLYIFGNNVNDKLGHIGYLCFYLGGAVASSVGYALISSNPMLGASGAVAAVTGAYLVLFPKTYIKVIIWFFYDVDLRAMYFIAFKLIFWDNVLAADPNRGVAYNAHLAGYGFGILSIMGLLSVGLIDGGYNDLWFMLKQWNRRRRFRDAVSDGYDPHTGNLGRKAVSSRVENAPAVSEQQQQVMDFRSRISGAMNGRNASQAAGLYLELLEIDASQTLPRQLQLDIANQLMAEGQWQPSADAYQKFLAQYRNYEHAEQVHLMLGLLYSRYLNRHQEAIEHLNRAKDKLSDPNQKIMCQQEIDKLRESFRES